MTKFQYSEDFKNIIKIIIIFSLIIYMLIANVYLEDSLKEDTPFRKRFSYSPVFDFRKTFSLIFKNILTPGLRNVMVDLLLVKAHAYWHQTRWYRIPEVFEAVTILQPEWSDGWVIGAWHMAYNVTFEILQSKIYTKQEKIKKIKWWENKSIKFLKSGLIINPNDPKIYFYLGWINYHKLKKYRMAIVYFNKTIKLKDHNKDAERLIAYSYEKLGFPKKALDILIRLRQDKNYYDDNEYIIKALDHNIYRLKLKLGLVKK